MLRALLLGVAPLVPTHDNRGDPSRRCALDPGQEYIGANLHDKHHPNSTASAAECCALCHSAAECVFWTYSPRCWGNTSNCCWLKTAGAWTGRQTQRSATSGSTRPLPNTPPPPAAHARYRCVAGQCVRDNRAGSFSSADCSGTCVAPVLAPLKPLRIAPLPVGRVQPSGWLRAQLAVQVNGLSGHLPRFWPDVQNSTWLYPENRWQETYSDRGGNLPYWLNGMVALVFQLRELSDHVDSTSYNLTRVVTETLEALVATQRANGFPMHRNFNLGTWNVVRSCIQ